MFVFALGAGSVAAQDEAPPPDLLSLAGGAVLVSAPADFNKALALTDGDPASNWNTATKKTPLPHVFVFELLAPATLTQVGIHGAGDRPGGVQGGSAKIVRIEGASDSAEGPYTALATLIAEADGLSMTDVAQPGPYRWLRYTVQGAHSDTAAWIYLTEVVAHGTLTPPEEADRFTGVFQTGRKDSLELLQDGTSITGCYVENSGQSHGRITGAIQDGVALVSWTSDQGITGTAFLTRDSTGALSGVRYRQRSRSVWGGPPAPEGTTTPCSPVEVAAAAEEPQDPIVQALEEEGVFRIYGIYFNYNKDTPKASSAPALNQLLTALQSAPELVVDIEGHTDADGSDAFNQDLSQRRAASVVAWLVDQGIAAERLSPVGKGEAEPVASNATTDGKALNRRVEVRKK
ncbi:MAG: OmpA family protein [Paracoccaceae bacterium]